MAQPRFLGGGGFKRRFADHVFEKVISLENLFDSWHEFRRGKSRRSDIQKFEFNLEDNLFQLHQELLDGAYVHGGYHPFYVADPKVRHIHKATVRDRVVHHALFRVLYPIFDRRFVHDSYSCRVGKGTHRAVRRLKLFAQKLSTNNHRNFYVLKCDIKKFFDSIDHRILLAIIQKEIEDVVVVSLIKSILGSFHGDTGVGIPLGNVTSQLFANIYLDALDQFVKHKLRIRYYIRYCDDFVILHQSPDQLRDWLAQISSFLQGTLKLQLHPRKVSIRKYNHGIDFLGYVILPHHTVLRTKTKRRLLKRITTTNAASYLGMLTHCNGYRISRKVTRLLGDSADSGGTFGARRRENEPLCQQAETACPPEFAVATDACLFE